MFAKILHPRQFVWLAVVVCLLAYTAFVAYPHLAFSRPAFPRATVIIQRADGQKLPFNVEIATTPEQHRYGLMFLHSLPHDAGMLFLFVPDQPAGFWMKNTYIPLDMLFVRGDGMIAKIATHTEPLSLMAITSDEPVRGVLEINGGAADRQGIHTGDKVIYPDFTGR